MIWTGLACLNLFINSVVWTGNAINWAPVWCDISSKFIIGVSVAIPAASLCINRRLYHIACIRVVSPTKADKRRAVLVDLAIGVGLPVLVMVLHYIVQGHRFNIFEDIGCFPASYYVWPIYPIIYLPPIIIGLFTATYSVMTVIAFHKNRSQFMALLSSNGSVTSTRFLRLMFLASVEVLFNIPINLYGISTSAAVPLNPWISWENVHSNFSRVPQVPSMIWRSNRDEEFALELSRWAIVFCAFLFFGFFGFADEARKNYRFALQSVVKRVGINTVTFGGGLDSSDFMGSNGIRSKGSSGKVRPVLPLFVHQEMIQHRDSFDSSNMSIADFGGGFNDNSSSDPEKSDFYPTMSYGALSIPDVGGLLADTKDGSLSSPSSQTFSSTSSITYPTPAHTRQNSDGPDSIEISSVHDSSDIESPNPPL
jgi:pheromone a factor receptor